MLGLRANIGIGKSGSSWVDYWATLISVIVADDDPTKVILTFPVGKSLIASDFTIAGKTISGASWVGGVLTLTVTIAFSYGDTGIVTFVKTGGTSAITNNVLYSMLLTSAGTGAGVAPLRMQSSADVTITLGTNAKFYTDAGGTANESETWTITSGALRTIYVKCTAGTATAKFSDITKLTGWGNASNDGWTVTANGPSLSADMSKITNLLILYISGASVLSNAMPSGLQQIIFNGNGVSWTYTGALPSSINKIFIVSTNVIWTYDGSLPLALTYLSVNGASINWTGLDVSGGNIAFFALTNYRISKMSSVDMITLLTNLTNRAGTLPATVTINDYADYASPPAEVTTAVNTLKAAKSITTVNLGA